MTSDPSEAADNPLRDPKEAATRILTPYHHIDPGFINHRKCLSVFGTSFAAEFNKRKHPSTIWPYDVQNDHLLVELVLDACKAQGVPALGSLASDPQVGQLFCSTENLLGTPDVYDKSCKRALNRISAPFDPTREYWLSFDPDHLVSDTGRLEQNIETTVSIVGQLREVSDTRVTIHPLIMGAPSFHHRERNGDELAAKLSWSGFEQFEIFPEDIDQFELIKTIDRATCADWASAMKDLSEEQVKLRLAAILSDETAKDWGGEQADHYTTSLSIAGARKSAAFMFKGPARFAEMTLDMCGKRSDQIARLATTSAQILVVQHCHDIGLRVRETLRAFAVQPSNPRQYMLLDGRDTFRLLKAYGRL
ncbi:MAG: hypothetical protein U0573_10585 [Phycisphaerales bacterium]|nr:hypothetical protein [Planctomycetota bacterium]